MSLLESGMASYSKVLASERNARALEFRCSALQGLRRHLDSGISGRGSIAASTPCFDIHEVVSIISGLNQNSIANICQTVVQAISTQPKVVKQVVSDPQVQAAIVNALSANPSIQEAVALITLVSSSFYLLSEESSESFINSDLTSIILNLLASDSEPIISSCVGLVISISKASGYGRDALVDFGIINVLTDLANAHKTEPISEEACEALDEIFKNPNPMEADTVAQCVEPIHNLFFTLTSHNSIRSLISALVGMSDKAPSIVYTLFDEGFYATAVSLLDSPEFVDVGLCLIGNLSNAQGAQIRVLLENGIFEKLVQLLTTEHSSDVFWVFSNMLESDPSLLLPKFPGEFIREVVSMVKDAPSSVKNEEAFFIASVIQFRGISSVGEVISQPVIEILTDVLGCGVENIITRCLDAVQMIMAYAQNSAAELFRDTDIEERLKDLTEEENESLRIRAQCLLNQLTERSSN